MSTLRAGVVVRLGASASPQFASGRGFALRVTKVDERSSVDGWVWLSGYQLDRSGQAVERRTVFVRLAGVVYLPASKYPK